MWYRADYDDDYDHQTESEYFEAETDKDAINVGLSKEGTMYIDIGYVPCRLMLIYEVDDRTECLVEKRLVWS